jgi:hypothetical protein
MARTNTQGKVIKLGDLRNNSRRVPAEYAHWCETMLGSTLHNQGLGAMPRTQRSATARPCLMSGYDAAAVVQLVRLALFVR